MAPKNDAPQVGKEEILIQSDPRFRVKPYQQMAASCSGAVITSLIMTPLDVVKIRLQAQQMALSSKKCFIFCNGLMDHVCPCLGGDQWYRRPSYFTGTWDALIKIARNEGITSLWSGLSPTLFIAIPSTVVYFTTYEQLRIRLNDLYKDPETNKQPIWVPMASGMTARFCAATCVSPMELIRTKMQSQRLCYLGVKNGLKPGGGHNYVDLPSRSWITLKKIVEGFGVRTLGGDNPDWMPEMPCSHDKEKLIINYVPDMNYVVKGLVKVYGYSGMWKGLIPTLYRDVPFSGIYWVCYEYMKSYFYPNEKISFWFSFLAGSTSGTIAAFLTAPFDVVKTHQQLDITAQIYKDELVKKEPKKSTFYWFKKIYGDNGVRGLYTGLIPRLAKIAPACAIMVSTFEYGKNFFEMYNMDKHKRQNEEEP